MNKSQKTEKPNFVLEYWDWAKKKGLSPLDTENRDVLNEFYYNDFHMKHPKYEVNGIEYFQALGKL